MDFKKLDEMIAAANRVGLEVNVDFNQPQTFTFEAKRETRSQSEKIGLNVFAMDIAIKTLGYIAEVHPEIVCETKTYHDSENTAEECLRITLPSGAVLKAPLSMGTELASMLGERSSASSDSKYDATSDIEYAVAELNKRVQKISNKHNCIRGTFMERQKRHGNYMYIRCTHKSTVFRVANAYDTEWAKDSRSGQSEYYFNLPEELDELIKFVEHDEKIYYDANPDKRPETET